MKWRICRKQRRVSEKDAEERGYLVLVKRCELPSCCPTPRPYVSPHGHAILFRGHAPGVNPWQPVFRTMKDVRRFLCRKLDLNAVLFVAKFKGPTSPPMPLVLNPRMTRAWE